MVPRNDLSTLSLNHQFEVGISTDAHFRAVKLMNLTRPLIAQTQKGHEEEVMGYRPVEQSND
jgi:hypothetical protein